MFLAFSTIQPDNEGRATHSCVIEHLNLLKQTFSINRKSLRNTSSLLIAVSGSCRNNYTDIGWGEMGLCGWILGPELYITMPEVLNKS